MQNWNKIDFIFCFKLHIDPITLRKLEFYTIQNILKEYEEHVDRENKEYEKQQREIDKQQNKMNTGSSFAPPKFDMPKFNIPKQ